MTNVIIYDICNKKVDIHEQGEPYIILKKIE